jgi:NADPH2:quinone reductase
VFFGAFAKREPRVQRENVMELWRMLESGRLQPVVGSVHSLEDGVQAFLALEQRKAIGKIVIEMNK